MSLPELPPVPTNTEYTLPPEPIPPLLNLDTGEPDVYSVSPLRYSTGSRINQNAKEWYQRRSLLVNPGAPVKSAVHPEIELWLNNVGDLDLRLQIQQLPADEWPLERFLPRVAPQSKLPFEITPGTFVIAYHKINSAIGKLPGSGREWVNDLRSVFPEGSRLILDFCIPDAYLDPIWSFSKEEFWGHDIMKNFDGIIAPNFSSYMDDPPIQRLLCEKMCTIAAREAYEMGNNVIPMLCWVTEDSLRREVDAIAALWPRINTVFVQLQSIGVNRIAELWKNLDYVEKYLAPLPFRYIINGCTAGWAIGELCRIFPRGNFHLVNGNAWMDTVRTAGADYEKANMFQDRVKKFENWAKGIDLPPPLPRTNFHCTWDSYKSMEGIKPAVNWIRDTLPPADEDEELQETVMEALTSVPEGAPAEPVAPQDELDDEEV